MPRPHAPSLLRLALAACALPLFAGAADPANVTSQPLTSRSQPAGTTRFTTLAPEQTGLVLENHYADPAMWGRLYREFTLGAIGTGLAAGDFDGDGRVDLFAASKTEQSRLFRNLGDWRFEDVTAQAGLTIDPNVWTQGAAFADIDNDGDLDLYVCRFDSPNLLFINQGDGTFREDAAARGLSVVDGSGMAAFADFDRDGWLDVYLQTNALALEARPTGQPDRLFRNRGDGTFEDVTERAGISGATQGHSATWWDFDADGWPDLYIANDFQDPDVLYRNNGDGTFTNALSWVLPHTPHSSMGADLGDVNNDGHIDLFVADMAATTRVKDHRGMAKVRAGLPEPARDEPRAAPQYMHNALYLGTGTTRAWEAAWLAGLEATDWTWSVRFEDLDNDGWLDLHVTNGMVRELHHADTVDRMMKRESQSERVRLMKATPRLDEANLAFRNRGDLQFENVSATWGLDHSGVSFASVFADFDNDGDLDLVFSNYEAGLTVCRNDTTTGHRLLLDLRGTTSNRFGIGARVELEAPSGHQVRELVLARGYMGSSEPVVHFGLGDDSQAERITIRWPSGCVQVLEELDADRRYTVIERKLASANSTPAEAPPLDRSPAPLFVDVSEAAQLSLPTPEADYNELRRQPLLPVRQNPFGPAAAVADLDGDGRDDLALGGTLSRRAQLLSNLGGGLFLAYGSSLFSEDERTPDAAVLLFEANGDGRPDLLVAKGGVSRPPGDPAYAPRLWFNEGDGRFTPAPADALPEVAPSAGSAAAADFDRDGDLDLIIGGRSVPGSYPEPADSLLLVNDDGGFRDVTTELAPALRQAGVVSAVLWSDVDGDGWQDILIAREWAPVLCLRNEQGKGFSDLSEALGFAAAGAGFWQSTAAADFNGDGRLDYAVGNRGLNTRYRASREVPALLYRGPLAGRPQAIEAAVDPADGILYPRVPRDVLASVWPALLNRFRTHDAYAVASLEEVVGAGWLAEATRFSVDQLQSGVFLSQPDGRLVFSPLPRLAQLAPIFGMWAGDATGDGHADLVFVGNSHAPVPAVGRFDGGLGGVLAGDGRGRFAFVPPDRSGWAVPFDAKALVALDLEGDARPDFFVTRNHDRTLAFRNNASDDTRGLAVRLRGQPGNPTAVGARVTLVNASGRAQVAEVCAGSGYLSQSTATLFFGSSPAAPPQRVRVHWPDGAITEHPWPDTPETNLLLLDAPTQ